MKEIMIDLETWGTSPDCVVRAICLAVFEPGDAPSRDGYTLYDMRGTIDQQLEEGREVDQKTVEWWGRQAAPLSDYLAYGNEDPTATKITANDLHDVSLRMAKQIRIINNGNGPTSIWSRGYFDIAILETLLGNNALPYWKVRDVRTLDSFVDRIRSSNPHDPVCDCEAQIAQVRAAYALAQSAQPSS